MNDAGYMRRAIRLARRGEGYVEPNPMVGCVIVRDGAVVGEGYHRRFGGPHAEVEALRMAGAAARGATVYVTLEPCAHHGKTPPCAEALSEAGVGRVVIGAADPTAEAGGGAERLTAAGIDVTTGVGGDAAGALIAPFAKRATSGLPYVILKWAMTADGAIATAAGHSQWISGERSRKLVHRWRGRVDAIMVGAGTARADDPMLTARGVRARRTARRVVIDPRLTIDASSQLVGTAETTPTTIAVSRAALDEQASRAEALRARGVALLPLEGEADAAGVWPLEPVMRHLVEAHGATNVLVEGGAGLAGALLRAGLVDELRIFIGPAALGSGRHVPPMTLPETIDPVRRIDDATRLQLQGVRRFDNDVYLRYRVDR